MAYSETFLVEYLKKKGDQLGRTPKKKDLSNPLEGPESRSYLRQFGSWRNALERAGFSTSHLSYILSEKEKDDKIFKRVQEVALELMRVPTRSEVSTRSQKGQGYGGNCPKRLGSWTCVLKKAGIISKHGGGGQKIDPVFFKPVIDKQLRTMKDLLGYFPSNLEWARAYKARLVICCCRTVERLYGNWKKAKESVQPDR